MTALPEVHGPPDAVAPPPQGADVARSTHDRRRSDMSPLRRTAIVAGVFYLMTEVFAIAGRLLYGPVRNDPNYVLGGGADTQVLLGGLFEFLLVVAIIGAAVTLYPVVKRQNHSIALGYVCARLLEAAVITFGLVSILTVVTLRQHVADGVGADGGALVAVAEALVAMGDWAFLVGPSFILGLNSLLLAYLMYRSQLVPRIIAVLGLVGGPLVALSGVAVLFGLYSPATHVASALPVFAWEVSLAVYLIVKGFKPSPITSRTLPSQPRSELRAT
jgi:hypothetical protein